MAASYIFEGVLSDMGGTLWGEAGLCTQSVPGMLGSAHEDSTEPGSNAGVKQLPGRLRERKRSGLSSKLAVHWLVSNGRPLPSPLTLEGGMNPGFSLNPKRIRSPAHRRLVRTRALRPTGSGESNQQAS